MSVDGVGAGADRAGAAATGANIIVAGVDERRVGKTDGHVISGRTILLEVAGLADADEGIVGMLPIECVGLEPFFATRNPVRTGVGLDAEFVRHQVGNDCLAGERR